MVIEDHTREYSAECDEDEREGVTIMMKKDDDDDEDVIDMQPSNYDELEKYVRKTLSIRKRDKIKLVCLVPYGNGNVMCAALPNLVRGCTHCDASVSECLCWACLHDRRSVIKDKSSLTAFHRSVRGLGYQKLQTTPQLTLAVCPVNKVPLAPHNHPTHPCMSPFACECHSS